MRLAVHSLRFQAGEDAAFHRSVDGRDGRADIKGVLRSPLAGAFLLRLVQDQIHQGSSLIIHFLENIRRDLDQIGFEFALVPFGKYLVQFQHRQTQATVQDIIDLAMSCMSPYSIRCAPS